MKYFKKTNLLTNVGVTLIDFNRLKLGSNYIQFVVDLKKPKPKGAVEKFVSPVVNMRFTAQGVRERSTETILNEVRESVATIPGIQRFSILRPQGGPAGSDIEVGIVGKASLNINTPLMHAAESWVLRKPKLQMQCVRAI